MLIVSGVNRTIFFDRIEHTPGLLHKIKFYCVYSKVLCLFFFLRFFLVVEDYDLSERTSHLLSVPLTLENVRIIS